MLLFKYKFKCVKCGEKEESKLTIDHIHPYSKGGPDDYSNLQILCKSCNSKKGTKANEKFLNITEDKC
jgi:5-methylcytosine-specific restriction endonuclease McrA